jgi:hypothetical protein
MPRTYSFDHFTTAKPDASKQKHGSEREKHTPLKSEAAEPSSESIHYGHPHAQTEELYKQRREEHEREEALHAAEPEQAPRVEAPAQERGGEGLKQLAQQAVTSVLDAVREVARGHPVAGTKRLAGDAVSGTRRVVKEVSARATRVGKKKQPGRKR